MRLTLFASVVIVYSALVSSAVWASGPLVLGASPGKLTDQVAVMAERTKKAQQEAKAGMDLLKLRIASKLAVSEEALARQVELLHGYEEQLRVASLSNAGDSDPQLSNFQALTDQTRATVTSQLNVLKDLVNKLHAIQLRMASDEDDRGAHPDHRPGPFTHPAR